MKYENLVNNYYVSTYNSEAAEPLYLKKDTTLNFSGQAVYIFSSTVTIRILGGDRMEQEELSIPLKQESVVRPAEGNIATGLVWGILISVPLWISVIGWIMGFWR